MVVHAYISSTWEGGFTGKEDQQFKASLRYTIGLSPAWDMWGQPRIYLYKEHVWEWSLMDLEHGEKNVKFWSYADICQRF